MKSTANRLLYLRAFQCGIQIEDVAAVTAGHGENTGRHVGDAVEPGGARIGVEVISVVNILISRRRDGEGARRRGRRLQLLFFDHAGKCAADRKRRRNLELDRERVGDRISVAVHAGDLERQVVDRRRAFSLATDVGQLEFW